MRINRGVPKAQLAQWQLGVVCEGYDAGSAAPRILDLWMTVEYDPTS
jgi:hypothetical protein